MPRRNRKPNRGGGYVARLKAQLERLRADYDELRDDAQIVAAERDEWMTRASTLKQQLDGLRQRMLLRRRMSPRRAAKVLAERSEN